MSTAPIRVAIQADDQYSAALSAAQAKIRAFGATSGLAGDNIKRSFHEARGSVDVLSDVIGVRLSRELKGVISQSQIIAPLLANAFPIIAAVGFIEVIGRLPEVIESATNALAGYGKVAREQYQSDLRANELALTHFKTLASGYGILQQIRQQSDAISAKKENARDPFAGVGEAFLRSGVAGPGAKIIENILAFKDANNEAAKTTDTMVKVLERINELQVEQNKKAEQYVKLVEAAAKKLDELRFRVRQESSKAAPSTSTTGENRISTFTDLLAQSAPDQSVADQYGARFKALQAVYLETRAPAELLAIEIEKINQLFGDNRGEIYTRAIEQIKNKYDETRQAVRQFGEEAGAALSQGVLMGRNWVDVLDTIVVALTKVIFKMYVLDALNKSSFGKSGLGSIFSALLSGFTGGHAGGGYMSPGQWGIVGENGPELAFAGSSGMNIVPNGKFGGGTVNYYVDARGGSPGLERDIVMALKQTENRAVARSVATIRESSLRGRY